MINSALYREPELLDKKLHRHKKLKPLTDLSVAQKMHAVFLTATEFPQGALEYPIIFVATGDKTDSGKPMVSPVALLGLTPNENLRVDAQGHWNGRYIPAFIRRFPFLTAAVQGSDNPGVFVDKAWGGFNDTEGEALFNDQGEPSEALQRVIDFLQRFDEETQRTRLFCQRVADLELLKGMQADATMPNGETIKIEGFLTIDEQKLNQLPDATVIELHRSGMLMLMQVHLISLTNMRDLVERKATRMTAPATATA